MLQIAHSVEINKLWNLHLLSSKGLEHICLLNGELCRAAVWFLGTDEFVSEANPVGLYWCWSSLWDWGALLFLCIKHIRKAQQWTWCMIRAAWYSPDGMWFFWCDLMEFKLKSLWSRKQTDPHTTQMVFSQSVKAEATSYHTHSYNSSRIRYLAS